MILIEYSIKKRLKNKKTKHYSLFIGIPTFNNKPINTLIIIIIILIKQ